ncbi:SpoIIE family protein phosphatase [Oscillospiraceae bacterium PP1C4]
MERPKKIKVKLQIKFTVGLVLLTVVLTVALGVVIAKYYRSSMEEYYSKTAFDQAKIAADYIDGDTIALYESTMEKDAYYETVREYLLRVNKTVGLKYFYVVVPRENDMLYIWDSGESGEEGVCELGDADNYYGGGKKIMRDAFLNPDAKDNILITNNETYGYLASAYVPISDSNGVRVALVSVDISMDKINGEIKQFMLTIILLVTAILLAFIVLYYFFIQASVIVPVKKLHHATSNVVNNQMSSIENFSINIKTGDEIEDLAKAFTYMTVELKEYIKNLSQITAEKERIGAELNVATQIQADMLPSIFPAFPERSEFDIYATMQPAKEVGGDFYDFFLIDNDHLVVVMADVSGKGVPAALFMVIAKTLLKNHAQAGLSPSETFTTTNGQLCENNEAGLFVTAWMGVLEISTGKFTYVNAGHNPPLVKRCDGEFEYLKCRPGFVLAGMEGVKYRQNEMKLYAGDTLYLYTDGVTEATDTMNELYGEARLQKVLNQNASVPLSELLPLVRADIDLFVKGAPQFDDITMLGLKISGGKL